MMKVALIHDFLRSKGGAEKVLQHLADLFPDAPIYTLIYDRELFKEDYPEERIKESFIGSFPDWLKKRHKFLLPFYPIAIERMDLSDYDLVISSSSAFSKGVITRSYTKHICYCHTPMRYVWDSFYSYLSQQKIFFLIKPFVSFYLHYLRLWDRASSARVDNYIANSETVAKRIKKYYRRESDVLYPAVDIESFHIKKEHANYFLIVSRLERYKSIETAIRAFNLLPNRNLVIIGDGSDSERLKRMAGRNIEFLGFESDAITREYFENCRAFIATAENEDFGMTPVEAFACGKPVLALRSGGYRETVREGITGEFYENNEPKDLMDGLVRLLENEERYDADKIRRYAEKYSVKLFGKKLADILDKYVQQ